MVVFEPSSLAAGLGALWATSYQWPVLVRIDLVTRRGELFAAFPASDPGADAARLDWQPGPASIAVGDGALWLALPGRGLLLRVDPASRETQPVSLPFPPSEIGAGPAGCYVIGPPGDGRLAAVSPSGEVTVAAVGRSLRLVAVAERLVWTVDDAAATVIALDARSLVQVAAFRHLGSPDTLIARGDRAWYLAAREVEISGGGGDSPRAFVWSGGPCFDLLRLDAATGEATRLCQPDGQHAVLGEDSIWVSGRTDDPMDEPGAHLGTAPDADADPVTSIGQYDLAGTLLATISMAGQVADMAVCDGRLWAGGFLRSRQAYVLSVLDASGAKAREADLSGVDITPWDTPWEPDPQFPPDEFAELARAVAERALTEPYEVHGRFGERYQEPPVSPAFSLERVGLRSSPEGHEITVIFRWAGQDGLLGFACPVGRDEDWPSTPDQAGGAVCTYLEENLKASGHGLSSAIRQPRDGITWLRWGAPEDSVPE